MSQRIERWERRQKKGGQGKTEVEERITNRKKKIRRGRKTD